MATISTSIELYDKVSAPINNMLGALNNMVYAFESVESSMDGAFDTAEIDSARNHIHQATAQVIALGNEIEENEKNQQDFNKQVRQGASDMDGLTDAVMGMVGAYASWQGVQKLVNMSDEYVQTTARLNMINDGLQTTEELQDKILASAQRSRAAYTATADTIAKLSLNAKDAFSSNDETIAFAENLNKLFVIAGTEQQSIASASLQLTQALGSGVLRGEEFNAVFEAAPNIMQTVADYMDVPIGKLRGMAADGQITADIVKNALLGATDEINTQFENMPMTWSQAWTGIMNELYVASQPILELISWLAQNWSVLEPIVLGVAAALGVYLAATKGVELATKAWAAAQAFFNGVMALNPVYLVIMGIILLISLIYSVVAAINKIQGTTISASGVIVGVIMSAISIIWNLFLTLVSLIIQACIIPLTNTWDNFANFFGNLFNDPVAAIIRTFENLANSVLGILQTIANGIDAIFGSNLAGAVQGWMGKVSGTADKLVDKYGNGTYEEKSNATEQVQSILNKLQTDWSWDTSDAYKTGYGWGEGLGEFVSDKFGSFSGDGLDVGGGYDVGQIPSNIADIADNTGKAADSLEITSEDLKYLRDIAEREVVNRFTTAEIKVEMTNNNNITSDTDLDGVIDYLANGVNEAMEKAAEGVHK